MTGYFCLYQQMCVCVCVLCTQCINIDKSSEENLFENPCNMLLFIVLTFSLIIYKLIIFQALIILIKLPFQKEKVKKTLSFIKKCLIKNADKRCINIHIVIFIKFFSCFIVFYCVLLLLNVKAFY